MNNSMWMLNTDTGEVCLQNFPYGTAEFVGEFNAKMWKEGQPLVLALSEDGKNPFSPSEPN